MSTNIIYIDNFRIACTEQPARVVMSAQAATLASQRLPRDANINTAPGRQKQSPTNNADVIQQALNPMENATTDNANAK